MTQFVLVISNALVYPCFCQTSQPDLTFSISEVYHDVLEVFIEVAGADSLHVGGLSVVACCGQATTAPQITNAPWVTTTISQYYSHQYIYV